MLTGSFLKTSGDFGTTRPLSSLKAGASLRVPGCSWKQPADHAAEPRRILHLPGFEAGAENARQIAHILGHQEIVLHEALDVLQSAMRLVAEALGDVGLPVEAQPVIAALRQEMQVAAHRPQEALALLEDRQFLAR